MLAERQGFEPWEGCPSTVFKTAAIDRSAISPSQSLSKLNVNCKWNLYVSSKKLSLDGATDCFIVFFYGGCRYNGD